MKRPSWLGRRLGLAALCALALGGLGCNQYSYLQIHVTLDDAGFSTPRRAMINICHVYITGATKYDQVLNARCSPPDSNDVGVFDFSTFVDSGTVNFKLDLFKGPESDATKIGEGTTSLAISSGNTAKGDLKVMYTGMDPL